MSPHILEEVEQVTGTVLLIVNGKLAASGDFRAIRVALDEKPYHVLVVSDSPRELAAAVVKLDSVDAVNVDPDGSIVVLAIACAAFANEIEDKTVANLTLAPIPRWQIVMPKLAASVCIAAPFLIASAFGTSFFAFSGDWHAALAVTAATFVGVFLYPSAFTWLGLKTTQAIGYGLLYIVLWEGFFARYVAGVRFFSIRYYSIGLMRGFDARRIVNTDDLSVTFAIVASVVVLVGFALLSIRRLRRMDVP